MKGWRQVGKWLLFLLLCGLGWQVESNAACAAGADVSVTTDVNPVVKGDIFYVMVTVTSTEEMSGFEGYFSYNQSVMKYITGGSVSSGNDDVFSISDTERDTGAATLKYSIQFKARRPGNSTVELKSPYTVYSAQTSEKMSVAYHSMNICVLSKKQAEEQQAASVAGAAHPSGEEEGDDGPADNPEAGMSEPAGDKDTPATALPGQTAPTAGSGTDWNDGNGSISRLGQEVREGTAEAEGPAGQDRQPNKRGEGQFSGKGLSRGICIAVIVIASLGLVFLGITFVSVWHRSRKEIAGEFHGREEEEEEIYRRWQERRKDLPDWEEEEGQKNHTEEKEQESLEMIEKRLEQKRRWLRKDEM